MSTKVNVVDIIKEHWRTLYDSDTGKLSCLDIFSFLILPLVVSISSSAFEFKIDDSTLSILVNFGAIFTALLLSVLVLVYDQKSKATGDNEKIDLDELFNNVCYSVLISISMVIFCLLSKIFENVCFEYKDNQFFVSVIFLSPIVIFLLSHLVLTILMVLKRLHALLG